MKLLIALLALSCIGVLSFHQKMPLGVRKVGKLAAELPIDEFDNFARDQEVLTR